MHTNLEPKIVYETGDFLVLNKPSGLIVHPKNENDKSISVTGWILKHYPSIKNVGEYSDRPGMMHRLDKETSGLLIVAKNQKTFGYFKGLFLRREMRKYYLALIAGHPKDSSGIITAPIGRIGMKRTTYARDGKLRDKKEAETRYRVVKKFSDFTLLEVSPKTGRTHQIRVHLKHIGHPVIGDKLYGPKNIKGWASQSRLFLHAQRLEFTSPDGKALSIETDIPEGLQKILDTLQS